MKPTWKTFAAVLLAFSIGAGVAYAATAVFQADVTLTVEAPNLQVQGLMVDGVACPVPASCTGTITRGQSSTFVFTLYNPSGSVTYVASSVTSIPGACGFTSMDSSISVSPGATGELSVVIAASSSATIGLQCTIGVAVDQS